MSSQAGWLTDLGLEIPRSGTNTREDKARTEVAAEFSLLLNSARCGELIELTVFAVVNVPCLLEGKTGNSQG